MRYSGQPAKEPAIRRNSSRRIRRVREPNWPMVSEASKCLLRPSLVGPASSSLRPQTVSFVNFWSSPVDLPAAEPNRGRRPSSACPTATSAIAVPLVTLALAAAIPYACPRRIPVVFSSTAGEHRLAPRCWLRHNTSLEPTSSGRPLGPAGACHVNFAPSGPSVLPPGSAQLER
jgi:hypothetical protein